jgi:exopolyphosphatase/pppGpp-phosphohydrolase
MKACKQEVIGVFDLGSARMKLTIAVRGPTGEFTFERFKEETGNSGKIDSSGMISNEGLTSILRAVGKLSRIAAEHGCSAVVSISTDILRRAKNGHVVLNQLGDALGSICVLNPKLEGLIFYHTARLIPLAKGPICSIDVGGGSVQIAWDDSSVVSFAAGTFRLEQEFQKYSIASEKEFQLMANYIEQELKKSLPDNLRRKSIIFGSNCMLDFVSSAIRASSNGLNDDIRNSSVVSVNRLRELLQEIRNQPPNSFAKYFPANPQFMLGADKALLNVLLLASHVCAESVIPTNESVGTGIARLALTKPEVLSSFNMRVETLKVL